MNPNSPYPNQPRARQQRMAQYRIIDEQHGGLVVSTFAYPSEWQARSQVVWNMHHTILPAQVFAMAFNPNGMEAFEFFPMQAFFWLEMDYGTVPIGQNSRGMVRMPPRPAPDALANLVIPAFRNDRQNLRVTGVQPVQNLWQVFNDPPPQQGEGLMARVEYEERGRTIEEEFYGVYSWNQSGVQLNWGFARLVCFRAERGQLDGMRETFWQIAASQQPNPQWKQLYDQVVQQLSNGFMGQINHYYDTVLPDQQRAVAQNIDNNARFISNSNARTTASIDQTRREIGERGQQYLTPQEQVGYLLSGQTPYHDPNSAAGNPHVVQGSPQYVRTDGQGGFDETNDPTHNPAHYRDGNWVDAEPVKPRR